MMAWVWKNVNGIATLQNITAKVLGIALLGLVNVISIGSKSTKTKNKKSTQTVSHPIEFAVMYFLFSFKYETIVTLLLVSICKE